MDPHWNIESVMKPPKMWNITRTGKGENTGRPIEHKPSSAAEEPANGAPLSGEANPMGNANRVVSFNDQVGRGTAQDSLTDTRNTMEKSSIGSQPSKESGGGTPTNQITNPSLVRLIVTTTCKSTGSKTPSKNRNKPIGKKGSKTKRMDPNPNFRMKPEKKEALRKEREAKRLAKAAKKATKAEEKMAKKQKMPIEEAICEPCRVN